MPSSTLHPTGDGDDSVTDIVVATQPGLAFVPTGRRPDGGPSGDAGSVASGAEATHDGGTEHRSGRSGPCYPSMPREGTSAAGASMKSLGRTPGLHASRCGRWAPHRPVYDHRRHDCRCSLPVPAPGRPAGGDRSTTDGARTPMPICRAPGKYSRLKRARTLWQGSGEAHGWPWPGGGRTTDKARFPARCESAG